MIYVFEKRLIFVLFYFTARWDRKNNPEPWNNLEPTQQYKVRAFASLFAHISSTVLMHLKKRYFIFLWLPMIHLFGWNERHMFVEYHTYLLCYLASKSITCPSHRLCTCVCVFSSSQLTWTTPSWRRTGLISESTCLRSVTRRAFALSAQIQTCDTEWSLNHTDIQSAHFQCGDRDH